MPQNDSQDGKNVKTRKNGIIIAGFVIVCLLLLFARGMVYLPADGLTAIQDVPYWMVGDETATVGDYHDYLRKRSETNLQYDDLIEIHGLSFRNSNRLFFFRVYLVVDLFFALFLVLFTIVVADKLAGDSEERSKIKLGINFFTLLCCLMILSDLVENMLLLLPQVSLAFYKVIHITKLILYILFFLLIALKGLRAWRSSSGKAVRKVTASSGLSILVIAFIVILLTKMAQGVNLMVDLFSSLPNAILFFTIVSFSAVVISHYAKFMYIRIHDQDTYRWVWSHFRWPIIYHYRDDKIANYCISYMNEEKKDIYESIFRHFLGSIFIIASFYAYLFAWNKTNLFFPDVVVVQFTLLISIVTFILHYYLHRLCERYKNQEGAGGEYTKLMRNWLWVFICANVAILILYGSRFIAPQGSDWNRVFPFFQFLLILFTYVLFRELRPVFAYFMGSSDRFRDKEIELEETNVREGIVKWEESMAGFKGIAFRILGNFTNNIFLLIGISGFRFILLAAFFILPLTSYAMQINGANYLLAYLILFYSLILSFLKLQFYKNPKRAEENGHMKGREMVPLSKFRGASDIDLKNMYFRSRFILPFVNFKKKSGHKSRNLAFLLLILGAGSLAIGNNLYLLRPIHVSETGEKMKKEVCFSSVKKEEIEVPAVEFLEMFTANMDPEKQVVVALTAFGGGLKANYNVLRTLTNIKDSIPHIMDHTLLMSGVSGGGVGLANYNLLENYKMHDTIAIDRKVDSIGNLNILSLDLYHMLYLDLFRMFIPRFSGNRLPKKPLSTRWYGHDRSFHAMKQYEQIISPDMILDSVPYQQIHREILDSCRHSPLLLMNSTSTSLEYGLASSVSFDGNSIPGAINILNPLGNQEGAENYTLGYYDAVSTVNRFPLMSPAAKIKDAGHFVDGGYFENSGLLSTISVLDRIAGHKWSPDQLIKLEGMEYKVVIVSMLNGKVHWINHLLGTHKQELKSSVNSSSQIGAVLKTVVGTEMLPNFFVEALKEEAEENDTTFSFIPFYIPYRLSMKDISQYLGGKPYDYHKMREIIEQNNFTIDSLLDAKEYNLGWGIVQPALSRKLSKEDKQYQDIMIENHPYNVKKLGKLKTELE